MRLAGAVIGIFIVIIIVGILLSCVKIVQQAQALVIERLGAYHSTWNTGIHIIIPFIDRIANKVTLKEIVKDFDPQPVITKDNVTMQIDTVVYFQITDPKLYTYGVVGPITAIENLTATTLRNIIGELELDETLTSRDIINTKMRAILDEATDPWGIKVENVELKDVKLPEEMQRVIAKVAEAEREKQAVITKSKGELESANNLAEASAVMASSPGALHLRTLATLNDLSSDQSNTIIFCVPVEVLEAFRGAGVNAMTGVTKMLDQVNVTKQAAGHAPKQHNNQNNNVAN